MLISNIDNEGETENGNGDHKGLEDNGSHDNILLSPHYSSGYNSFHSSKASSLFAKSSSSSETIQEMIFENPHKYKETKSCLSRRFVSQEKISQQLEMENREKILRSRRRYLSQSATVFPSTDLIGSVHHLTDSKMKYSTARYRYDIDECSLIEDEPIHRAKSANSIPNVTNRPNHMKRPTLGFGERSKTILPILREFCDWNTQERNCRLLRADKINNIYNLKDFNELTGDKIVSTEHPKARPPVRHIPASKTATSPEMSQRKKINLHLRDKKYYNTSKTLDKRKYCSPAGFLRTRMSNELNNKDMKNQNVTTNIM